MRVAVVGCAHGELDLIYAALAEIERTQDIRPDLLLCPGDFQAVRNWADLQTMACPPKFRDMRSFWRYYAGHVQAPVPTLFVGGNHEASSHLQEIPLGGLVAPNMYFLGNAGVVNFRGLRIAGLSGVYTEHNYEKDRFESPPYPRSQIKSVYHTRREDVERLLRLRGEVDVFLSHDWPRGISGYGDVNTLLRAKPFLKGELANDSFGNPGAKRILDELKPPYWFAAHMHVKFPALVDWGEKQTKFLALDKALPRRDFVQILDIPVEEGKGSNAVFADRKDFDEKEMKEFRIDLDPEWLTILRTEAAEKGRSTPVSEDEIRETVKAMETNRVRSFVAPISDFVRTGAVHDPKAKRSVGQNAVALQESNKSLISALQLETDTWISKQQIGEGQSAETVQAAPATAG